MTACLPGILATGRHCLQRMYNLKDSGALPPYVEYRPVRYLNIC